MIRVLLPLLLALTAGLALAADPAPLAGSHLDLACDDCHLGPELADCDQCHAANKNIHPTGVIPSIPIPEIFSLGADGELLCRSCHLLHGGNPATYFLNGPAEDRSAFCAACHGQQMARTNPHQALQGESRCAFCHASVPGQALGGAGTARLDIVKLCDFCHGAVARDHPRNIDPTLSLPTGLPLAPDGSWTCVTCHNPHGTTYTTHYVRPLFAQHFERGKEENPHQNSYFACKGCHSSSVAAEIRPPDFRLRYKGDINILCVSCHITDRGHHPTGLPLPPFMLEDLKASGKTIPLDAEGRVDCYTCHNNNCDTDRQRMTLRHYDRTTLNTDLCWTCHTKDEFSKTNPHVDDMKLCTRCHATVPVPGDPSLLTVSEMVCLHCHDVKPHPMNADHLQEPSGKINPDPSLPLSPNGEVTCITCHDPHAMEPPRAHRLRADQICSLCHWR